MAKKLSTNGIFNGRSSHIPPLIDFEQNKSFATLFRKNFIIGKLTPTHPKVTSSLEFGRKKIVRT